MDFPISVPGIGLVDGKFADEDPLVGTPGSLIPAQWGNGVTLEILNVIQAAGLVPSELNNTQLRAAITALAAGRLIGVRTIIATGTYTPTPGTTSVVVEVIGAGGGGGGTSATSASTLAASGGGGGGGYSVSRLTAGFSGVLVTIGAGGAGGAAGANTGGTGGSTSFGALLSASSGGGGGGGPAGSSSGTSISVGGVSGNGASGNLINSKGSRGGAGLQSSVSLYAGIAGTSGRGGSSGGEGLQVGFSAGAVAGNVGLPGQVIIWEYA